MDSPTPLQSLIGGIGVAFPIHSLLLLNGAPFGISGFFHRGIRGDLESAAATIGLILGGVAVASVDGQGPELVRGGLSRVVAAGLLVGAGTKVTFVLIVTLFLSSHAQFSWVMVARPGKWAGSHSPSLFVMSVRHMLCGVARFSTR
jgi:hypothetical protein